LWEFGGADVVVLIDGADGIVEVTLGEILPRAFVLEDQWKAD
jgi:hypothetical protein